MQIKKLILIFSLFICSYSAVDSTEKFFIDATVTSYFNNWETPLSYRPAHTLFGVNGAVFGGFNLDKESSIAFGGYYGHEFGEDTREDSEGIILFYSNIIENNSFLFGSFPREKLSTKHHTALFSDSLYEYRPTLEGMANEYSGKYGDFTVWADWTGRRSDSLRESFLTGFIYKYKTPISLSFSIEYLYYHLAMSKKGGGLNEHVEDNGGAIVGLGYKKKLSKHTITIGLEGLWTFDKIRTENTIAYDGLGADFYIDYLYHDYIGFKTIYYKKFQDLGGRWAKFGNSIYRASTLFQNDLIIIPIKKEWGELRLDFSFLWVDKTFGTRQKIVVEVAIP